MNFLGGDSCSFLHISAAATYSWLNLVNLKNFTLFKRLKFHFGASYRTAFFVYASAKKFFVDILDL